MTDHYEMVALFAGTTSEEEIKPIVDRIHAVLQEHGATVTKTDFWGKRRLAYEITHIHHGYYDVVEFDLDTTKLQELEKTLQLDDTLLRHQIVRKQVKTPEQLAAEQHLRERIAAHRQAEKDKEVVTAMTTDSHPTPEPVPVVPAAPVSSEQISEKLEEILESDKIDV